MLVQVNLDIFCHTNIEHHRTPQAAIEWSSRSSMLAMAVDTGNSEALFPLW